MPDVADLVGGVVAWKPAQLPVATPDTEHQGVINTWLLGIRPKNRRHHCGSETP
jgi:hypothetical protein